MKRTISKSFSFNKRSPKQKDNVDEDTGCGPLGEVVWEDEPSLSTSLSGDEQRDTAYGTDEDESTGSYRLVQVVMMIVGGGGGGGGSGGGGVSD